MADGNVSIQGLEFDLKANMDESTTQAVDNLASSYLIYRAYLLEDLMLVKLRTLKMLWIHPVQLVLGVQVE